MSDADLAVQSSDAAQLSAMKDLCTRAIHVMGTTDVDGFETIVHPDAVNREAISEPPASRGSGPAAFLATARWLQDAFADLRWEIHEVVAEGDLVVLHTTMSGRQTGPFVVFDADGEVVLAIPPTQQPFAVTQSHWMRVRDGKVIEHWANRDDRGMGEQLGWMPPPAN